MEKGDGRKMIRAGIGHTVSGFPDLLQSEILAHSEVIAGRQTQFPGGCRVGTGMLPDKLKIIPAEIRFHFFQRKNF